ncbi:hypothetical protein [uncultured Pontibacter sp.]|uniref:hypothetical protein n=1 Tax=uncultured Pontibacter sp. TaxID=453356 RepID=UPI002637298B|nr:hypothetical protein [uncultured Pontibacter sp.]
MRTSLPSKFVLTVVFLLVGASISVAQTKFAERKGGHAYKMDIPDYMVKTFDLNDVASLQYYNKTKEAYTIVVDDEKEHLELLGMKFTSAEEFLNNFAADYKKEEKKRKLGKTRSFEANGNNVAQTELRWKDEEGEFFMLISAVETKTHFYKVLCWTLAANEAQLKEDFKQLSASIQD